MPIELIHPMLVHFPIALVITAFGFDLSWVARSRNRAQVPFAFKTASILLIAAALAAIVTAFFGDSAFDVALKRGFTDAQLEAHQTMGIATAIVLPLLAAVRIWVWRTRWQRHAVRAVIAVGLSLIGTATVVVTAYFGGRLVYELGVNVHHASRSLTAGAGI